MNAHLNNTGIWRTVVVSLLAIALAACSSKQHDEVVALSKCMKAANYLEDSNLGAAAEYRASFALKNIQGGAKYAMDVAQELRDEAEPQGSSTNPAHVIDVAQKWKDSSYCKKVEADFAVHVDEQVKANLAPVADSTGDKESCNKYVVQVEMYTGRHAQKYHAQVEQSIRASLDGSLGRLKDFQRDVAKEKLAGAGFGAFAAEVYEQCKAGGALSEKILLSKSMQEAQSPTTKALVSYLEVQANKGDCGEFPQDYCKGEYLLTAAATALEKSRKCDQDPATSGCAASSDDMIKQEFEVLEHEKLVSMQEKYAKYVADPEKFDGNAQNNILVVAEKCKRGAIEKGLRDVAYGDYVRSTCLPQAKKEFVRPQAEILARVTARLSR